MILRSAKQLKVESPIKKNTSPKGRKGVSSSSSSSSLSSSSSSSPPSPLSTPTPTSLPQSAIAAVIEEEPDAHASESEVEENLPLELPSGTPLLTGTHSPPLVDIPFLLPLQPSAALQYNPPQQHVDLQLTHTPPALSHPSLLPLSELEHDYTMEVIAPALGATLAHFNSFPQLSPNSIDTSMDDFLEQEGINIPFYVSDMDKLDPFTREVHRLVVLYTNESMVISHECDRYAAKLLHLLKEQSKVRYVSQEEIDVKTKIIHGKFENVRTSMRLCVCSEIKKAVAVFGYKPKKHQKKCFRRKVTRILNTWFCDHLTNPYPTDLEKQALSKICGLNITQICNWFANKRIRHMRASKEQDAKSS